MSYCGASRREENRTFSPTQSFSRLTSSNSGRTPSPPSHPHAATTELNPLAIPNARKPRRSIMTRKPPTIPTRDHRAQRRGIDDEDENDMHDEKRGEDPDGPEMPIARRLKAAEQCRQPGELRGLVDRESREHRQHAK